MTIVACASAQSAAKYPAGVDPSKCPNFPICDNAALHNQAPVPQYNQWQQPAPQQWNAPAPQWQQPAPQQWNAPAPQWQEPAPQQWNAPAPQWNAAPAPAPSGGDKFPAGVSPQSCPNYPYCDVNAGASGHQAARVAPLPGYTERLYPAGVSAAQCPNYPEC
jgi:Cuticle protein CPCFC